MQGRRPRIAGLVAGLALSALALGPGCSAIASFPMVYGGTQRNVGVIFFDEIFGRIPIISDLIGAFWVFAAIDLPFSFAVDTALVPISLPVSLVLLATAEEPESEPSAPSIELHESAFMIRVAQELTGEAEPRVGRVYGAGFPFAFKYTGRGGSAEVVGLAEAEEEIVVRLFQFRSPQHSRDFLAEWEAGVRHDIERESTVAARAAVTLEGGGFRAERSYGPYLVVSEGAYVIQVEASKATPEVLLAWRDRALAALEVAHSFAGLRDRPAVEPPAEEPPADEPPAEKPPADEPR